MIIRRKAAKKAALAVVNAVVVGAVAVATAVQVVTDQAAMAAAHQATVVVHRAMVGLPVMAVHQAMVVRADRAV